MTMTHIIINILQRQAQQLWTTRATSPLEKIANHEQVQKLTWKDTEGNSSKPSWFTDTSLSVQDTTVYRAWYKSGYPTSADTFWKAVLSNEAPDSNSNPNKRPLTDAAATEPPAQRPRTGTSPIEFPATQSDFMGELGT